MVNRQEEEYEEKQEYIRTKLLKGTIKANIKINKRRMTYYTQRNKNPNIGSLVRNLRRPEGKGTVLGGPRGMPGGKRKGSNPCFHTCKKCPARNKVKSKCFRRLENYFVSAHLLYSLKVIL